MKNNNGSSIIQLIDSDTAGPGKKLLWRRGNCELWQGYSEGERRSGNVHYFVCEPGVRPTSFEGLHDAWLYFRKLTNNSISGSDPRSSRNQRPRGPEQPSSL